MPGLPDLTTRLSMTGARSALLPPNRRAVYQNPHNCHKWGSGAGGTTDVASDGRRPTNPVTLDEGGVSLPDSGHSPLCCHQLSCNQLSGFSAMAKPMYAFPPTTQIIRHARRPYHALTAENKASAARFSPDGAATPDGSTPQVDLVLTSVLEPTHAGSNTATSAPRLGQDHPNPPPDLRRVAAMSPYRLGTPTRRKLGFLYELHTHVVDDPVFELDVRVVSGPSCHFRKRPSVHFMILALYSRHLPATVSRA